MRVNVYNEEMTNEVEVVRKSAEGRNFVGLRFYLKSHEDMYPPHHQDDDRSAVTFWVEEGHELDTLAATLGRATDLLYTHP